MEKQKKRQISREEKKKWHGPKDCLLALFPLRVGGGKRASQSNPQTNDFMLVFGEFVGAQVWRGRVQQQTLFHS